MKEPQRSALDEFACRAGSSRAAGIHDHLRRAAEYLKADDPNSAATEYSAVLALNPKDAEANANLGPIAFLLGDYNKASQRLRNALAIDPSLAKTQALLGMCEMRLGRPAGQFLLEESFPRLKDTPLPIHVGMELAEAILGSAPNDAQVQPEGEKELETSVRLDGVSDRTECLFGGIAIRGSDWNGAYSYCSRAFALNPGDTEAQIGLGPLLVTNGKPQRAVKYFRMTVQSDPLNEQAHDRLETICRSFHLKDEGGPSLR